MQVRQMTRCRGGLLVAVLLVLAACGSSKATTSSGASTGTGAMGGMAQGSTSMMSPMSSGTADPMAGMDHSGGGMGNMSDVSGDGTTPTVAGYTLHLVSSPKSPGTGPLTFTVTGADGKAITDAVVEQTKKLHLIVVNHDLSGYQHLHPDVDAAGLWRVQANFATPGTWHVITDLTPVEGKRVALGADITIAGTASPAALPAPSKTTTVDGYAVALLGDLTTSTANLDISIDKGGAGATDLTAYLGAGGHLVALNVKTLGYTHLHPLNDPGSMLRFEAAVPVAGRYRLFLQFASGEAVHTAEFTVDVAG